MCGRFSRDKDFSEIALRFNPDKLTDGWWDHALAHPWYNITPSQYVPVLVAEPVKHFRLMSWGLVPSWAKDHRIGQNMINARAETVADKPSYKRLLFTRRCIVPATGFYEWPKERRPKIPMHFRLKGGGLFGFAGLWDRCKPPDGQGRDVESFTIITTTPNELVSQIHNRMPVILRPTDESGWLDPTAREPQRLLSMLTPYPSEEMESYQVTRAVNSPAFNGPQCIAPLSE